MRLLIDGYNVIYTAGVPGHGVNVGMVERGRLGLLKLLVEALQPAELAQTVVVFDARGAEPGLPREFEYCGIRVRFAPRPLTADEVIEELLRDESAPDRLTVVSSDRRVQHAARRHKAKAIDSQSWYESLRARQTRRRAKPRPEVVKPTEPLSDAEVARWLAEFGGEESLEKVLSDQPPQHSGKTFARQKRSPQAPRPRRGTPRPTPRPRHTIPRSQPPAHDDAKPVTLENPFPPGYGDDVVEES